MNAQDTIVAIATPPGLGGVGIVRLSGPKAYDLGVTLTRSQHLLPRKALFRSFYDEDTVIDEGVCIYFKAPHSFTGEDIVELQAHGSPIVLNHLVERSIQLGARLAKPGEFSERAFLNDKIDLTQAEAISDLISASSKSAARLAIRSLQGEFSKMIQTLNERIVYLRLYVEAAIDFPEEEINFLADGKVATLLQEIISSLENIRTNAFQGTLMREGAVVVIAGPPNAGKSTLINALAQTDIAIVTSIPGTTRDVMREHILLDDIPLQIVDTAGLRETEDIVEQEGIKRAWKAITHADCVLLVSDIQKMGDLPILNDSIRAQLPEQVPLIHVINKIDRVNQSPRAIEDEIYLSAREQSGLSLLKTKIKQVLGYQSSEGIFLARQRHLDALNQAYQYLLSGEQQLKIHQAGELLAEDLRLAHQSLCAITGEFTSDDLLGEIFSSFCIGK